MARARTSSLKPEPGAHFGALPTEAVHPEAAHLDEMPAEKVVALLLGEEARAARAAAARTALIGRAAELVASKLAAGGRLVINDQCVDRRQYRPGSRWSGPVPPGLARR